MSLVPSVNGLPRVRGGLEGGSGSGSGGLPSPPSFRLALGTAVPPDSKGTRTRLIASFHDFPRVRGAGSVLQPSPLISPSLRYPIFMRLGGRRASQVPGLHGFPRVGGGLEGLILADHLLTSQPQRSKGELHFDAQIAASGSAVAPIGVVQFMPGSGQRVRPTAGGTTPIGATADLISTWATRGPRAAPARCRAAAAAEIVAPGTLFETPSLLWSAVRYRSRRDGTGSPRDAPFGPSGTKK